MKQRFSSLDVKVIAHELQQTLVSLRVSNVYDLSSKILLFKFAKPDNKKQLVVDTGFRCHLTEFGRTTAAAPSHFVARLRKFLKTRRVTSVSQVGTDRVLELTFSDGQYRLFLEFFASGNLILTDTDLNILAIARNVSEGEGQEQQRIGLQYSLENRQNYHGIPDMSKERVRDALKTSVDKAAANPPSMGKGKKKAGADLRRSLAASITEVPPVLVEHVLQGNGFDLTRPLSEILESESLLDDLYKSVAEARQTVENTTSKATCQGYIFGKYRVPPSEDNPDAYKRENLLYEDFHPFLPKKLSEDPETHVLEISGYNQTVDEFFSSLEGQKLESRLSEKEAIAQRRLESAKEEQNKRIEGLQEVQAVNFRKAAAIEINVQRVQEAMDAVNGLLAQGMDWVDISKLVEREKRSHNPVAQIIKTPLKLEENTITLTLAEEDFQDDDEEDPYETDEESDDEGDTKEDSKAKPADNVLLVDINLSMTPWSNAREYYGERKTAAVKEEKTQMQAARAMKNTEQKINDDLKKGLKQEKALLQPIRKQMWFEKFIWFISSEGYLVIGGKDAPQNEMLYRRYLRKGDVYCHADVHGASSVIIKNNPQTPDAPIPPATLAQAGSLSVCTSSAWDSKAGMGSWWVNAEQVSKSAPTGEFLPQGSFMVRGTKNFLPPGQLLMGLGFMFRISEESKARHVKHRLYDQPTPEAASSNAGSQTSEAPDSNGKAEVPDDDASADGDETEEESEGEEGERDDQRQNPLQGAGNNNEQDNVAEAEEGVSELSIKEENAQDKASAATGFEKDKKPDENAQEDVDDEEEEGDDDEAPSKSTGGQTTESNAQNNKKKAPAKRGQKGKAKKIAAKYKGQDEEDRAAAEALIGAKAGKQRQEAEAKAKADKEAEQAAAKERRRAQHDKQKKQTAEHEEVRRVMMEEGVDMLDDDEAQKTTSLDDLVGKPLPGDEIVEVIPMCAPWNALNKTKYKVKLQPGTTKKGKAVKEILERLKVESGKKGAMDDQSRDTDKMWPRETDLIKGLKPEEIVNNVPVGKVRVMMPGGAGGGGGGGGKGGKGAGKGGKGGKGGKKK